MGLLLGLGRVLLMFFLDQLLWLFQFPPRFPRALLAGTFSLWYCAARFAIGPLLGGVWTCCKSGYC